ncbi:beta-3 adrenergic receptor-like [Schistocerca americana]|uniref:beta-3 adrenergic receptor-like n=1 Tax=Schistocerca americana TaxID=7009 RepID=UPI001F4FDB53|nr:beta-3 adrenergic receptor-like [Schistocerca americana]XP_046997117.1 beta-3 adrenergic receptor-like [Schistocerca americana]
MTQADAGAASEPPPPLAPAAPAAGAVPVRLLYLYSVPALLLLCAASVAVNARVLVAARWLRRPLSPTLRISLSLAAADAFASTMFAAGLLLNSLLKAAAHQQVNECLLLTVEALRLSGIIATVAHLLALATNHYLGILRPLHYPAIMTPRNTSASIVVLWLLPAAFFFGYFSLVPGQGFQCPGCCAEFLYFSKFRLTFSSLFFVPLVAMAFIYARIFVVVRRHQAGRLRYAPRSSVPGATSSGGTAQQAPDAEQLHLRRQSAMARSVKTVHTTLRILVSYLLGLIPAVLVFVLVCDDCPAPLPRSEPQHFRMFFLFTIVNLAVILKTLVNPFIYASRMHEIKVAMQRMSWSCRAACWSAEAPPPARPTVAVTAASNGSQLHDGLSLHRPTLSPRPFTTTL